MNLKDLRDLKATTNRTIHIFFRRKGPHKPRREDPLIFHRKQFQINNDHWSLFFHLTMDMIGSKTVQLIQIDSRFISCTKNHISSGRLSTAQDDSNLRFAFAQLRNASSVMSSSSLASRSSMTQMATTQSHKHPPIGFRSSFDISVCRTK